MKENAINWDAVPDVITKDQLYRICHISKSTALYLLQSGKKGVGLDTIGVDPIADAHLSIHRRLFQDHEIVVMENLANLDQIGDGLFTLFALPLRYQDADGSPIRAVAVLDGEE